MPATVGKAKCAGRTGLRIRKDEPGTRGAVESNERAHSSDEGTYREVEGRSGSYQAQQRDDTESDHALRTRVTTWPRRGPPSAGGHGQSHVVSWLLSIPTVLDTADFLSTITSHRLYPRQVQGWRILGRWHRSGGDVACSVTNNTADYPVREIGPKDSSEKNEARAARREEIFWTRMR